MISQIVKYTRGRHSRTVDGILVRLLWRPEPDGVRDGERPMDVFLHRFASHARHGAM